MRTIINHKISTRTFLIVLLSPLFVTFAADNKDKSLVTVQVSGATEELADNLKAFLPSLRNLKCDSTPRRVERFIDASSEKLVEGAEALGYFEAKFNMTPHKEKQCWVLKIAAQPGKTVKVKTLNIQLNGFGKDLAEFQAILANPPYQSGDVLVSQYYEDFKTRLKRTANSLGFFDADLSSHTIKVNTRTHQADIDLVFDTGARYRFGKVTLEQDILESKYINRYTLIKEGDAFRSDKLIKQQRLLEKSSYFKNVQVRAGYDTATKNIIPIDIKTTRRKRYTYKGALGFATDDGFFIDGSMDTHWVNSKGHQLNVTTRYSEKDPSIGLKYKVPLWKPEYEFTTLSASWNRSDNDDIRGTALKLGIDYHRRNDSEWEQIASINYLDEETQVNGTEAIHSQLTLFGVSTRKTERDDAVFPTKGWRLKAGLKGAAEGFLSDQSILQLDIAGKYLHTFKGSTLSSLLPLSKNKGDQSRQANQGKIILQGELGTTFIGDFNEIPKSLRFFAGGQNSVRGYGFESLGEINSNGDVIGGKHLLIMSAEYEHPFSSSLPLPSLLKNKLSAAAFIDAGNAFNDWNDNSIKVGYGMGVRYKSPLGPIRIDLAVPENDPTDVNLYFSLGPDL
ncbi:MAG: autotransporter assembly complex family protein [Thiotrichaceae bacterium]